MKKLNKIIIISFIFLLFLFVDKSTAQLSSSSQALTPQQVQQITATSTSKVTFQKVDANKNEINTAKESKELSVPSSLPLNGCFKAELPKLQDCKTELPSSKCCSERNSENKLMDESKKK